MNGAEVKDLILFRNFSNNETVRKAVSLFSDFNRDNYVTIQRVMADMYPNYALNRTCWQNQIVNMLASSENVFSLSAEKNEAIQGTKIWELAVLELKTIMDIYYLDFRFLIESTNKTHTSTDLVRNLTDSFPSITRNDHRRMAVVNALECDNPNSAAERLFDYWKQYGAGVLETYCVFEWKSGLLGIKNYDAINLKDIIGYEAEKKSLIENTRFLLEGKSAANVLLYGDSGTGKSSSVKALINEFAQNGLKLINIGKDQIEQLPDILDHISDRGGKFIIFIDDLSFEEDEVGYKYFKSILEGNAKCHSGNSAIYVTSNRRNIVREVWSERENTNDIHLRDTLQEKKSLADRFGLIITYATPTKDEYLDIVKGLAEQKGIRVNNELLTEALKWDVRRGGRSGRTAKYFIDYYFAKSS